MIEPLRAIVQSLASAEAQTLLLARCQPVNWTSERLRLEESWRAGLRGEPEFKYHARPQMLGLRAALGDIAKHAQAQGTWGNHLAARAAELQLEAALVENIGQSSFRPLAKLRFSPVVPALVEPIQTLARQWCSLSDDITQTECIAVESQSNEMSLTRQLQEQMQHCRLQLPIRASPHLASVATLDNQCVWIRAGESLTPKEAQRIAVHEIWGHALRRKAGSEPQNVISVGGFANCDEDEEGRATWFEEQHGVLHNGRKVELARRYWAAHACQAGATFTETAEHLLRAGAPLNRALGIALRVWRGGGLAREIIYLDAYVRVKQELTRSPNIEQLMQRGRLSLRVATLLADGVLTWP